MHAGQGRRVERLGADVGHRVHDVVTGIDPCQNALAHALEPEQDLHT